MTPTLPTRLGLCPVHFEEFYFPIGERDGTRCPQPGCSHELTVYVQVPPMSHGYFAGDELRHHAGDVWRVVEADLPGDGGVHGGMIEVAGDYRIECVRGREVGTTRRVHADYLHGDGWTRVPSGVLR